MSTTPVHHRLPRAGIDPITTPTQALLMVAMAAHHPPRHETIVLLLDDARRGISVVVVSGTEPPDSVIEVVECLAGPTVHHGRVAAMVVASVRPRPDGDRARSTGRADDRDVDRWLEMSDLAEQAGVEVVEWFVLDHRAGTRRVSCPRDRLGEPPRW